MRASGALGTISTVCAFGACIALVTLVALISFVTLRALCAVLTGRTSGALFAISTSRTDRTFRTSQHLQLFLGQAVKLNRAGDALGPLGARIARSSGRPHQSVQPLLLRARIPVLHGNAVGGEEHPQVLSPVPLMGPVEPGGPLGHECVCHDDGVVVLGVLPVGEVHHGAQIGVVQFVVGRPNNQIHVHVVLGVPLAVNVRDVQKLCLQLPLALVEKLQHQKVRVVHLVNLLESSRQFNGLSYLHRLPLPFL